MEDSVVSGRFGYREVLGTPSESAFSVSPSNSSFLHSPSRSSFTIESPSPCGTSFSVDTDPSPQGTTQDLQEFLQVNITKAAITNSSMLLSRLTKFSQNHLIGYPFRHR